MCPVSDSRSIPDRADVDRNLARRLRGVGVEQRAALLRDRADRGERLQHADLVVRGHDRDEDRAIGVIAARSSSRSMKPSESTPSTRDVEPSRSSRGQESSTDLCSVATVTMWSPRSRSALGTAPLIARLFDSLAPLVNTISDGAGADERRDLRARRVDRLLRFPAVGVLPACGIAELLGEVRQHRLEHPRIDRRRRVDSRGRPAGHDQRDDVVREAPASAAGSSVGGSVETLLRANRSRARRGCDP